MKLAAEVLDEMPPGTQLAEVREAIQVVRDRKQGQGQGDHRWPPIIALSEANGYSFKIGSAELSPQLQTTLSGSVVTRLLELIAQYNVNVIEVIGHTDEQRIMPRPSNLDATLFPYLRNATDAEQLIPGDNAGLGLSRAAAVTRVLTADARLAGVPVMPLSAAQLIDTDDRLSTGAVPQDRQDRRRIELRVRRSQSSPELPKVTEGGRQNSVSDQVIKGQATVIDGDTIDVDGKRIRLWGIVAVEKGQVCKLDGRDWECGRETAMALVNYLKGHDVICTAKDYDRYQRVVATCIVQGKDLGAWLSREGLALDFDRYSKGAYAADQASAKAGKRGLWRGEFIPPWVWRETSQRNLP